MATFHDRTVAPRFQRGLLRLVPDIATVEALADAKAIGYPDMVGVPLPLLPAEPDTAAQARALHARRELHQALDYGFALLDALDLSPRGLDIIDGAIAHLDAMDAPAEDMEPYLAGYCGNQWCDPRSEAEDADVVEIYGEGDFFEDAEEDDPAEAEPDMEASIGWPNDFTAVVEHRFDTTDTDVEAVNEDGDDCGEAHAPWWDRIGYPVMEVVHA